MTILLLGSHTSLSIKRGGVRPLTQQSIPNTASREHDVVGVTTSGALEMSSAMLADLGAMERRA
jgi:hypothetical protein